MSDLRAKFFVLSPNDVERCEMCPTARVFVGPKEEMGHAAWWGIGIHRYIEYAKTRGRDFALAYVAKKFKRQLKTCEKLDVDSIPDGDIEPQYVIDTEQRVATMVHDYRDADPAEHVFMRGDLIWEKANEITVADYKTGDPAKQKIKAKTSLQLLTIATAVWLERACKPAHINAEIVSIYDGEFFWGANTARFTAKELDAHFKRLRRVHLNVLESRAEYTEEHVQPETIPGPHCKFCRAATACPDAEK